MKKRQLTFIFFLLSCLALSAHAALNDPLTTIKLDTPVHFLAPDGSDLLIEAGTYSVEPAEEWIRVISGERHDALLIEAKKGTHELELEQPMALSVPGDSDNEQDHHYVMLLLPGGKSLEATGTYSGIRTRGFFQDSAKKVKTTAKRFIRRRNPRPKKPLLGPRTLPNKPLTLQNKPVTLLDKRTNKLKNRPGRGPGKPGKVRRTSGSKSKKQGSRPELTCEREAKRPGMPRFTQKEKLSKPPDRMYQKSKEEFGMPGKP